MEKYKHITDLYLKLLRDELSPAESVELDTWLAESHKNRLFNDDMNIPGLMPEVRILEKINEMDIDVAWKRIQSTYLDGSSTKVARMKWWRYMAAASLVLLISLGMYLILKPAKPLPRVPVAVNTIKNEVIPNTTRAYLTLDNGATIQLDSLQNGLLATQGNVQVMKKANGALSYATSGHSKVDRSVYFNTVTVPRGSDVVYLQLSDNSKVWLNAASSIRYPVAFGNDDRKVEITGEVYFEITHKGNNKRFIVSKGAVSVTVLGTRFNVNTYDNEENIKVTLLEGSVKVQSDKLEKIIKPGQQAVLNGDKINVVNEVDLEQVMAWKEGKFVFNNTNIQLIMRQVERWYDLEPTQFANEEIKKWNFNGELSRYNNASKVLQLLEKTGAVKITVEGKKIIVKQP